MRMSDIYVEAGPPLVPFEEIRKRIQEHVQGTGVVRAILFGSFARGEADFASDVDLVLIEPTAAPFVERGRSHLALFQMGVGLDLLVYAPEEYERLKREGNPFIARVEREGVTIYARPER
jgi:predicted nucleotidyltransferase